MTWKPIMVYFLVERFVYGLERCLVLISAQFSPKNVKFPQRAPLRLLRTFAGVLQCPPGKNSYARHFKGKHSKLYIVGKLNKCRFQKKYELPVFLIKPINVRAGLSRPWFCTCSLLAPASPRKAFLVPFCPSCLWECSTNQNPPTAHIFEGLRGS